MSKRILAVDDSRTMRDMVAFTLQDAGYTVATAEDGAAGLKLAQSQGFDAVITDVNMPNMDGIALTRALRGLPAYRTAPILVLTTETEADKRSEGKAAGATGWIVKPFQPDALLATVKQVVGS